MNVTEKAAASSCVIQNRLSNGVGSGCGVFIAPDIVLTAWHVVEGNGRLNVTSAMGFSAQQKPLSKIFRSVPRDLALVKLDKPIGTHFLRVAEENTSISYVEQEGWLVSRFNSKFESQKLKYYSLGRASESVMAKERDDIHTIFEFVSGHGAGAGYSGSPIINRQGRIVSVVTHALHEREDTLGSYSKLINGPSQRQVADFTNKAKFE